MKNMKKKKSISQNFFKKNMKGFTLIELLVVIGIVAVLSVVVILTLNPAELLRQARDSTRLYDVKTLARAFSIITAQGGTLDLDGPSYPTPPTGAETDSCINDVPANKRLFVSVPSDNGETTPTPPSGWTIVRVPQSVAANVDSTGWIPVDLRQSAINVQPPLTKLPLDPVNTFASGFYYTYTCGSFEFTAAMESQKYIDIVKQDGGILDGVFETGTDLTIVTTSLRPSSTVTIPTPTVSTIIPSIGTNNGTVSITTITGSNFQSGASVKLSKTGQTDIIGSGFTVANGTTINGGSFNLAGSATGAWDVVVTNSGGSPGMLPGGFTVNAPVAGIVFDTTSSAKTTIDATSLTWQHTISNGTNRLLMVGVSMSSVGSPVTSMTYGGVPLTKKGFRNDAGNHRVELWYLVNPVVGTNDIVFTASTAVSIVTGATSWSGVNQTTPLGGLFQASTGGGTSLILSITSNAGEVVQDVVVSGVSVVSPGSGQVSRWSDAATNAKGGGSTKNGPTTQMSWTFSGSAISSILGVAILPN
ncbi:MAG: type II secretion system protein [Patescibacteria group bacterium]